MADSTINVADLPDDQFLSFLKGGKPVTNAPAPARGDLPPAVPQATANALADMSKALGVKVPDDFVSEQGKRMGIRPGVFLDTKSGAPANIRFDLGLDENMIHQLSFLASRYGAANVDLTPEGRFVLRNQRDESGNTQDVLVNPEGLEGGDVVQMGGQAFPIAAGVVGARLGGALGRNLSPVKKIASAITGMAIGTEGAGSIQDLLVREGRGQSLDVGQVAKQRTMNAIGDEALGFLLAGGAKVTTKLVDMALGLGGISTARNATTRAVQTLQKSTGVKYPLTPGERAESSLLMRGEGIAGGQPGGAGTIDQLFAAKQKALQEVRRVYLGLPRTMSDGELKAILPDAEMTGENALRQLGRHAASLEEGVATAKADLQQTATTEAQRIAQANLKAPLDTTEVGGTLRQRVVSDFKGLHDTMEARYNAFLDKPEVQAYDVSGRGLAKAAADIEAKLTPQAIRPTTEVSYDSYGSPMERTGEAQDRLNAFVDGKVKGFLDELKGLGGAKVSVNSLKQIRTSIDNAIKEGIAIPGTDTKQLSTLREVVNGGIEDALNGNPALLSEWKGLGNDYRVGMERFNRTPIRQMLIREGESGSIGNTSLAERVMGNSPEAKDNYNAYKEFFGEASSEFKQLQRSVREKILGTSGDDLAPYISGSKLQGNLGNMRIEVANELFGTDKHELFRIGEILKQAGARNLDTQELAELARGNGTLTAAKVRALIDAESVRARDFNNTLITKAAKGTLDAEAIRPSDFVRYASSMDSKEAQRIMGILSNRPDIVRDINRWATEDLWNRSMAESRGRIFPSAKLVDAALAGGKTGPEGAAQEATWRVLAGDSAIDGLRNIGEIVSKSRFADMAAGGQLAGSAALAKLTRSPDIGELRQVAARYLFSTIYTGPLKHVVSNLFAKQDAGQILNAVITSQPFIEDVMGRFGPDIGLNLMREFRAWTEPQQKREMVVQGKVSPKQAGVNPADLSPEDFKKWLSNAQPQDTVPALK